MFVRIVATIALLASPAWAQQSPAQSPAKPVRVFDLHSDALRKIVRDTASTQYASASMTEQPPAKRDPNEVKFVPPEKPAAEAKAVAVSTPARAPRPSSPVYSVINTVVSEVLGVNPAGDVEASNAMLRCRVEKEIKSSPPGPTSCASGSESR